jgi:anti-anti-sigma factor
MSEQTPVVPIEKVGSAIIARPQGKMIEDHELKTLMQGIDQMTAGESTLSLVVLDLSRVALVPSLVLGLLVQLSTKCKARGQKLKLAGATVQVRQVFAITRLDRVFEFSPSVEAAME